MTTLLYLVLSLLLLEYVSSSNYQRMCYFTNWAQYRPGAGKFVPEDVPTHLCTHLVYAFATMEGNKLKAYEWNDESTDWMTGMYVRFNNLKKENPSLKTLLGVGGWNFGTEKMTAMLKTRDNRAEFIKTSAEFLRKWDFDGLDLDFEYPAGRGSPAEDKWRYAMLTKEMRRGFERESRASGKPRLLLTAAVAAGKSKIDAGYDVPTIARALDYINIMTYDFHGQWEDRTGHNCPLYAHGEEVGDERALNLAYSTRYWVESGAPPSKINVGLPLYARTFTLTDKDNIDVHAPASGGGTPGPFTREKGYLAYYEVCDMLNNGASRHWIDDQQVPFAVKDDQWVAFDDEESLAIKVNWVKKNKLAGIMVWALDLDDFHQSCGGRKWPLLSTINDVLNDNYYGPDYAEEEYPRLEQYPKVEEYPRVEEYPKVEKYPRAEEYPRVEEYPKPQEYPRREEYPKIEATPYGVNTADDYDSPGAGSSYDNNQQVLEADQVSDIDLAQLIFGVPPQGAERKPAVPRRRTRKRQRESSRSPLPSFQLALREQPEDESSYYNPPSTANRIQRKIRNRDLARLSSGSRRNKNINVKRTGQSVSLNADGNSIKLNQYSNDVNLLDEVPNLYGVRGDQNSPMLQLLNPFGMPHYSDDNHDTVRNLQDQLFLNYLIQQLGAVPIDYDNK